MVDYRYPAGARVLSQGTGQRPGTAFAVCRRIPKSPMRLSRRTLEAKRSKHMTIAEVLNKANEGGYHIYGSDGMNTQAAYMGLLR
jgi:hypothetical protein